VILPSSSLESKEDEEAEEIEERDEEEMYPSSSSLCSCSWSEVQLKGRVGEELAERETRRLVLVLNSEGARYCKDEPGKPMRKTLCRSVRDADRRAGRHFASTPYLHKIS
jgi:hypothetical protein